MIHSKSGDDFIRLLNRRLDVVNGKIQKRPLAREKVNGTHRLFCIAEGRRLDKVIEGPNTESVEILSPAAKIALRDRANWLRMARQGIQLGLAIYPERGRRYSSSFKNFLTHSFPHIIWYFPEPRHDLRDDAVSYPHIIADALLRVGVIALTTEGQKQVERYNNLYPHQTKTPSF